MPESSAVEDLFLYYARQKNSFIVAAFREADEAVIALDFLRKSDRNLERTLVVLPIQVGLVFKPLKSVKN